MAFSPKSPTEVVDIGFDMSRVVLGSATITNATIAVTKETGAALPNTLVLVGSPSIESKNVIQRISQGVIGNTYILTVTVTTSNGQVLTESSCIAVIEKGC